MRIICINKCCSIHNVIYVPTMEYSYFENDYVDGLEIKYYAIYDYNNNMVGYHNIKFISDNFISVFEYNQELGYINHMYNFYMDYGIKLIEKIKRYENI